VSESYERDLFPGEDALGKRIQNGPFLVEVVGVVADARLSNVRWKDAMLYRAGLREPYMPSSLQVRTSVGPAMVIPQIALAVQSVHPRLLLSIRNVDDVIARSLARERLVAATSGFFGLTGLVLTGIGLFGLAASVVAHRTSELGLRLALGASRGSVVREALRGTALVFAGGLAAGVAAVAMASRAIDHLIAGLLIGLRATDWMVLGASMVAMLMVAALATILPALRAARADPLTAIRSE
jgi:ABC-type antimicrobial peptide transport system permease subunit